MLKRPYFLPIIAQNAALAVVALTIMVSQYTLGGPWWLAAILSIALALLFHNWSERRPHLYLALEFLLILPLMFLNPLAMVLFFTFSAHAMIMLPDHQGALWVAAAVIFTAAIFTYSFGWPEGLVDSLAPSVGYIAFGYSYYARAQADVERRRSQALLGELQTAHRKLQGTMEQAEELAVAEERNRLAREMHDTLGHRLTVAAVQLEGADRLIPSDPERARQMVRTVREQVGGALTELRRVVATLRTPLEANLPLPTALTRLARGFEGATGLTVQLSIPERLPELPPHHRLAIYRAGQEGLTNIQRHAQANQVWLNLSLDGRLMRFSVADDGIGIPPGKETDGFGLRGLRERVTILGGELELCARPEGGARLDICLPLPVEAEHD